jgi:hypothetical protein
VDGDDWTVFLVVWFLPYILVRWGIRLYCDILDEEERRDRDDN